MCASCEREPGVMSYNGATLCARCGSRQEWAPVIDMLQRGLSAAEATTGAGVSRHGAVAADPFTDA